MSSRAIRIAAACFALTTVALAATACGKGSGSGQIQVGLITKTDTNPYFVKMKEGAQKAADAAGVKLVTAAGKFDGDNASQVTAIENMVAEGVKGIMITASDTKAIVPAIAKARAKGVEVFALDTPTEPQSAVDALFATNNFTAGQLIGKYAKAVEGDKPVKIAMIDLNPGVSVGTLRHNGFLSGYGAAQATQDMTQDVTAPNVVCAQAAQGDQAKAQSAMETCLQKDPGINLVYTINEPSALGAYTALKDRGQGERRADRVRRRRLHRHPGRQGRQDRRHLAAVPAEDGPGGRPGHRRLRQDRQEDHRLHRHRREPDHRQAAGGNRLQGRAVRHGQLLGLTRPTSMPG